MYLYYVKREIVMKVKSKRNEGWGKWSSITEFSVNGVVICEYSVGKDFFAARSSNLRNVKKTCRKTVWNASGLSKVLGKDIKVGGGYKRGNSVFYDDSPSNGYTGSVLTKKMVEELLEEEKNN